MPYAKIIRSILLLRASASPSFAFKEYEDRFRLTYSSMTGKQSYLIMSEPIHRFSIDEMDWKLSFQVTDMIGRETYVDIESFSSWLQGFFLSKSQRLEVVEG